MPRQPVSTIKTAPIGAATKIGRRPDTTEVGTPAMTRTLTGAFRLRTTSATPSVMTRKSGFSTKLMLGARACFCRHRAETHHPGAVSFAGAHSGRSVHSAISQGWKHRGSHGVMAQIRPSNRLPDQRRTFRQFQFRYLDGGICNPLKSPISRLDLQMPPCARFVAWGNSRRPRKVM